MHSAAPGSGSTCLAAASAVPGTVPNAALREGAVKSGKGGDFTLGHPSGTFRLNVIPDPATSGLGVGYKTLSFPRTARIICDGTVYIKNNRPPDHSSWVETDELTAASLFLKGEDITIQR